jgi:hypothetical protein
MPVGKLGFLQSACSQPKSTPVNPFAIASLLLFCLALALRLAARRNAWRAPDAAWPYYARRPLVGPAQHLYQRLVTALPGFIVLSNVPVPSLLGVRRGHDSRTWTRRVRHLQYDFVVCSPDATTLVAIQLDDNTRSDKTLTHADRIKQRASNAAGVRLLHWQASALPEHTEIQTAFGVPLTHVFEEVASSANQSWWPPISSARRDSLDT